MDTSRIAEIFVPATGKVGTGYVIEPGLILTALHVVGDLDANTVAPMRCSVRPFGEWTAARDQWLASLGTIGHRPSVETGWLNAELAWPHIGAPIPRYQPMPDYGRPIDLAVLRILTQRPLGTTDVQWRIAGFPETMKCTSIGFPKFALRDVRTGTPFADLTPSDRQEALHRGDLIADTHVVDAVVHSDAALKSSQFYLYVTNAKPTVAELWRGMSGAPVFDEYHRLVGVVTNYTSEIQNGCIVAERLATATNAPAFAELLKINLILDSLDEVRRTFLSTAQRIAGAIVDRAEQTFDRNLLSSFIPPGSSITPSKIFVRPEFRRRTNGKFVVPTTHLLNTGLDLNDVVAANEAALIIGEPGSGKSFAAADLARHLATSWAAGERQPFFPLLLFAKDLHGNQPGSDLGSRLAAAFERATNQAYCQLPMQFVELAQNAQCPILLIIDGVDEIIGDEKITTFLSWINATVKGYSGTLRVLLFTRPLGLDPTSSNIDQFVSFLLFPFNNERRHDLVQRLFQAFKKDISEVNEFLERLPASSLLDNPAILTMSTVAALGLPVRSRLETRGEIINAYIEVLTTRFVDRYRDDFSRAVSDEFLGDPENVRTRFFSKRDRSRILSTMGFMATETEAIDACFFEDVYERCATLGIFSSNLAFDKELYGKVLRMFALRLGLLVETGSKLVFSHNLLREYLAAQFLSAVEPEEVVRWLQRWRSPLWREALLMALPVWLTRERVSEAVILRLRTIATSTYEGGLFCGEALLERLPITEELRHELANASFEAIQSWNICENLLLGTPKANPSALVRRLLPEPDFREHVTLYLRNLRENWCPFTVLQFVRLLSEVDESRVLTDLATSGTPFIRATAAKALVECGRVDDAVSPAISVMKDLTASIGLARSLVDIIAEANQHDVLHNIVRDTGIDTCVRLYAATRQWKSSPSESSRAALESTFFGTAHDDDIPLIVADALFSSRVIFSSVESGAIAPKTASQTAVTFLSERKDASAEDRRGAIELHQQLTEVPANGLVLPTLSSDPVAVPPDNQSVVTLSPYDHPFVKQIVNLMSEYEKDPTPVRLEAMIGFEKSQDHDEQIRMTAAKYVNASLSRTMRTDLLTKRLNDRDLPVGARVQLIQQLAELGEADQIRAQLSIPDLPSELREQLPEALQTVGLTEHIPDARKMIVLDRSMIDDRRAWQFRRLRDEDAAAAVRLATSLAEDPSLPRSLRRVLLTSLVAAGLKGVDLLAELAAEEPATWPDFLADLSGLRPHFHSAALVVLRATAPEPTAHLHFLEKLVGDPISGGGIDVLLEFADRIGPECSTSAAVFDRLTELIDSGAFTPSDAQREKLINSAEAALQQSGQVAVSAAVTLWRLVDLDIWVGAIGNAVNGKPDQYRLLATGLSLPPAAREKIAEHLSLSTDPKVLAIAAKEFCGLFLYDRAFAIVRKLIASPDDRVDVAIFKSNLLGRLFGLKEELTGSAARLVTSGIIYHEPINYENLNDVFYFLIGTPEQGKCDAAIKAIEQRSDTLGARIALLWKSIQLRHEGNLTESSWTMWQLCLRLPDELWIRERAQSLAVGAAQPKLYLQMLQDEFSYFRRRNNIEAANQASDKLTRAWRTHLDESLAAGNAWTEAYAQCKAALQLSAQQVLNADERAEICGQFGWVCFQLHRDEETERAFEDLLRSDADPTAAPFLLASAAMIALGRYDEALKYCERAIHHGKTDAWLVNRAVASIYRRDFESADRDLQEALTIDSDYAPAWDTLGWARNCQLKWNEAIIDCTRAIELGPGPYSHYNRAFARWSLGQFQGALADLKETITQRLREDKSGSERDIMMGWRKAADYWDRSVKESVADFLPHLGYGVGLWLAGDLSSAAESLARANDMNPGIPEMQAVCDKLNCTALPPNSTIADSD